MDWTRETSQTRRHLTQLLTVVCVFLLICSPIAATTSSSKQTPTDPSLTNETDRVKTQENTANAVRWFYRNLQQEGVRVDTVCAQEHPSGNILHVIMEETDQTTRVTDAEVTAALYATAKTEYTSRFPSFDRVVLDWPADGEFTDRTMYISNRWMNEYLNGQMTGEELVRTIAATESSYDTAYEPSDQATCHPDTPESAETGSTSDSISMDVEGNRSVIMNAENGTPKHVVSKLLNNSLPVKSYLLTVDEQGSYQVLYVELPHVNRSIRREQAKQAALIFADARKQGYNATSQLLLYWVPEFGPHEHYFIQVEWVDKYLNGEWSKQEYLDRVLETMGSG